MSSLTPQSETAYPMNWTFSLPPSPYRIEVGDRLIVTAIDRERGKVFVGLVPPAGDALAEDGE